MPKKYFLQFAQFLTKKRNFDNQGVGNSLDKTACTKTCVNGGRRADITQRHGQARIRSKGHCNFRG